jgi:dihydroorotate dehydrogenase
VDELGGRKPLFSKVAPALREHALDDVIAIVAEHTLATNTTNDPALKALYGAHWRTAEGGLSGDNANFRRLATQHIARIYRETAGPMAIIGAGGVKDALTALETIKAGAHVAQVVTAISRCRGALPGACLALYMEQERQQILEEIRE